jgi:hypothetical protein
MKKMVAIIAGILLAMPALALADLTASGIVGQCSDCHTMHNSQMGTSVAQVWDGTQFVKSETPIQNLLKMDCIACHASPDATGPILSLSGGSKVPEVSHPGDDNLAGGNFRYSTENQRHGHNVADLTAADNSNAGTYNAPPGFYHASTHGPKFMTDLNGGGEAFGAFTCAGARGCHGTRSQLLTGFTDATTNTYVPTYRRGLAAISGAHHNSYDGAKATTSNPTAPRVHNGQDVADGYRFIPGLKGYGNTTSDADRWKNASSTSHNEYYGVAGGINQTEGTGCNYCHDEGTAGTGVSARATFDSTLKVPNDSMSGFCTTCHGEFHSSAGIDLEGAQANGVSGAFLRHPSDYVLPTTGEYANYTTYNITAPVARSSVPTAASDAVSGGAGDMVMCLSCHAAHASQYDYMLRGDYTAMKAGNYADVATATAEGFCLACHTTKGVLPGAGRVVTP